MHKFKFLHMSATHAHLLVVDRERATVWEKKTYILYTVIENNTHTNTHPTKPLLIHNEGPSHALQHIHGGYDTTTSHGNASKRMRDVTLHVSVLLDQI